MPRTQPAEHDSADPRDWNCHGRVHVALGLVFERGYARWQMGDGLVSPWWEGDRLYLFAGRSVHVMDLPVRDRRDDPQPSREGGL